MREAYQGPAESTFLRKSGALKRAIFNSVTFSSIVTDPKGVIQIVTAGAERIFGYQAADLVNRRAAVVLCDAQEIAARARALSLEFSTPVQPGFGALVFKASQASEDVFELTCIRQDGSRFPAVVSATSLRDAHGGLIGYLLIVTENKAVSRQRAGDLEDELLKRQQAELALRRERDRAQRYLEAAEVILLALDMDGRITLVNRKGCDLLEWTAGELLGRDFFETCLPTRTRAALKRTFYAVAAGDCVLVDSPILTRSRAERLIEWRNTLLRDDDGRVVGTFSSGADITERAKAAEVLRTMEERMRFALEAAGVGIWDMDYATGVLTWSKILERQYGLQPGTFGGTFEAYVECVHPQDRQLLVEATARALRSGTDFSLKNRTIWPDGTVRWLSGAGRIRFGEDGKPVRGVGVSLDVSERHAWEEQYLEAQKMDAIGRLAASVSHDFNNLLTAILGYCELLLDRCDPADPRRRDIEQVQKAGMSAAALTRQLLSFSRKEIIQPTLLDMNTVVADVQAILARLIGENVKVELSLGLGPAPVTADRGQMEQIVMNLALNARDAMPTGGTLTIQTAIVGLEERDPQRSATMSPGQYVALTVTDTGTGMTPEVQARLFEPFFTTKPPGKGTGLGLATIRGAVVRSGGSVNVSTEVGRGTAVRVCLPKAEPAEAMVPVTPPAAERRARGETVLVVDDAEGVRELAKRLLQREGYHVLIAADADDAQRLFHQHGDVDLLLVDIVMPGASGPKLVAGLLAQQPALKAVYMSGYAEDAAAQHDVVNPDIAFLRKPFTAEALSRAVGGALNRSGFALEARTHRP